MVNSTDYVYPNSPVTDALIGGGYFLASVVIGMVYLPCLAAMRYEDMWKHSCIKVPVKAYSDCLMSTLQLMYHMGIADMINMSGHCLYGFVTLFRLQPHFSDR